MTDMLAHRGPDGRGVREFTSDGLPAALGHRRLSIIDPTPRGAQPMSDASGRYWITFNGEIYNYRELHDELRAAGQTFSSDCDTEVLLALYAHHGPAMLNVINGMYAFAIWDTERRELFIARDRLGVKPLYYSLEGGVLAFASEIKALLVDRPAPSIRHDALPDYLTFLWVPDPDTLFEGIYKLPPGHFARFSGEELEISQYWDVAFDVEAEPSSSEWFERLRVSVQEAVHRQMVSDVPIGAFLSGGLDSGAVVATMREHLDQVSTYTVGFDPKDLAHEPVPDDLRYARMLGAELGVDYNERILTPSIVELLPKLVWHMDEPVADPAAITTYLICQAAREQMTVVLSGMGADGHVASLFPGDEAVPGAGGAHVIAANPAGLPPRISLSPERLTGAGFAALLVAGPEKAETLATAQELPGAYPVGLLLGRPQGLDIYWAKA